MRFFWFLNTSSKLSLTNFHAIYSCSSKCRPLLASGGGHAFHTEVLLRDVKLSINSNIVPHVLCIECIRLNQWLSFQPDVQVPARITLLNLHLHSVSSLSPPCPASSLRAVPAAPGSVGSLGLRPGLSGVLLLHAGEELQRAVRSQQHGRVAQRVSL